jgi:2,3-bisphosphoglycerate-dependent phosphoglycerate mutase
MELLLIRHALPVRIDEGTVDGPADPHLAPLGVAQAEALAAWLSAEQIDAIWCSPMRRALETAAPVSERLGHPITVEDGLAEYDREAASYIPIEELKAANDPRWSEVPEQPEEFKAVVVEAVERIVAAHTGQRVAVICHGGVVNAYAGHVLGVANPLFFLPEYTSITRVLAASSGERSIQTLNESAHLRGLGAEPSGEATNVRSAAP